MNKDNKLEQEAYNKYYELKDYLGRLQYEYQTCHTRYMNETDKWQRTKAKRDLDDVSLRIRRTQQEMDKIKNSIHLKDSMDMLKLSGFTVDEEVNPKFKKVMEEYGKGELKSSSGEKVTDPKQAKAIAYSESKDGYKMEDPKEIEAAIKKVKASGHPNPQYLAALERALVVAKQERGMKDSCEKKVYTKGTGDGGPGSGIKGHTTPKESNSFVVQELKGPDKAKAAAKVEAIKKEISKHSRVPSYLRLSLAMAQVAAGQEVEQADKYKKTKDVCSNKDSAIQKECNEILKLSGFIS